MTTTTTSSRALALLTGLGIGAAALAGCGQDAATQAARTMTPTSSIPQPPKANAAQDADRIYLRLLDEASWAVRDQAQMVRVAHAECAIRQHGTTNAALTARVAAQYKIDVEAARSQLTSAEQAYCPSYLDGGGTL